MTTDARTIAGPVRHNARTADEKIWAKMPPHLTGMRQMAEWLFLQGYSGPGMEPFRNDPVMQLRRRSQ